MLDDKLSGVGCVRLLVYTAPEQGRHARRGDDGSGRGARGWEGKAFWVIHQFAVSVLMLSPAEH